MSTATHSQACATADPGSDCDCPCQGSGHAIMSNGGTPKVGALSARQQAAKDRGTAPAPVDKPTVRTSARTSTRTPARPAGALLPQQYAALAPRPFDPDLAVETELELESTQQGEDIIALADRHAGSFLGAETASNEVWNVIKGRGNKTPDRQGVIGGDRSDGEEKDRRARAFIEASRHTPKELIPPKLYRGLHIDDYWKDFQKDHQPGMAIELSTSAFSSSKTAAESFADGDHPVLVEFDTSDGAQALPIQNLTRYPQQHGLAEFVVLGKFEVVSFEPSPAKRSQYILKIKQTGMF